MDLVHEEGRVVFWIEAKDDDGAQPMRHLFWMHAHPVPGGWRATFDAETVEHWLQIAVPADFPGGDKRQWRLTTRYAVARLRESPTEALGIMSNVLPDLTWQREG